MRKASLILILATLVAFMAATAAYAQSHGTYGSLVTGDWTAASTWGTWDTLTVSWVPAGAPPPQTPPYKNVFIRTGDTVTVNSDLRKCRDLRVETGAVLMRPQDNDPKTIRLFGNYVDNFGEIGEWGYGISFACSSSVSFVRDGAYHFGVVHADANNCQIAFGCTADFWGIFGGTGLGLYATVPDTFAFSVGVGDTLRFSNIAGFSFGPNPGTPNRVKSALLANYGTMIFDTAAPGSKRGNFNAATTGPGFSQVYVYGPMALADTMLASADSGNTLVLIGGGGSITNLNKDTARIHQLRVQSGGGFAPDFPVVINNQLQLFDGTYDPAAGLRLAGNAIVYRTNGRLASAPAFGQNMTIWYANAAACTTGYEMPGDGRVYSLAFYGNGVRVDRDVIAADLDLNSGVITVDDTRKLTAASCVFNSGYVTGTLGLVVPPGNNVTRSFPVGTAGGFSPLMLMFTSVSKQGIVEARAAAGVHPDAATPANCLQRYWSVNQRPDSLVEFTACLASFWYLPADFNTGFTQADDEDSMVAGQFGAGWSFPHVSYRDTATNMIQIDGLTSFSDFTLAKDRAAIDPTGVNGQPATGIYNYSLSAVRPNPVRGSAAIQFSLAKPGNVSIELYNVAGQRVRTIVNGTWAAGQHSVNWNGKNEGGQAVAAGVYMYKMNAEGFRLARKLVVVR